MSEKTNIEWASSSWSPWIGCTKVSAGCKHCYAETLDTNRFSKTLGGGSKENPIRHWGKGAPRYRTSPNAWKQPLKWNREARASGSRPRVFPSLCDIFDREVETRWRLDFFHLIWQCQNLDWLVLTKRPEDVLDLLTVAIGHDLRGEIYGEVFNHWLTAWANGAPPSNVWLGASVEDQENADQRIPELLKIPAKVRFLSVEPLLGAVDLAYTCFNGADSFGTMPGIHWVIVGGESGSGARPCNVDWVRSIVNQCQQAGVAAFVKQLGSHAIGKITSFSEQKINLNSDGWIKDRKGGDMAEWPEDLRVREFPKL